MDHICFTTLINVEKSNAQMSRWSVLALVLYRFRSVQYFIDLPMHFFVDFLCNFRQICITNSSLVELLVFNILNSDRRLCVSLLLIGFETRVLTLRFR